MQRDLDRLMEWGDRWGMRFNSSKCNIMRISRSRSPMTKAYQLGGDTLQEVDSAKYLWITISKNLEWSTHVSCTAAKAERTLGFLKRNLKHCPENLKRTAYISLVRPTLEYGSSVWDPHLERDKASLERVQRKAARFIKNDHRNTSSVSKMLQNLGLPPLEERRKDQRLTLIYKITHNLVEVDPEGLGLEKPTRETRANNNLKYKCRAATTPELKFSLIYRTIPEWNKLPSEIAEAETVARFKTNLAALRSSN